MPESGAIFDKLSPREYLTIVGQLYNWQCRSTDQGWLDFFGLMDRIDRRINLLKVETEVCWIAALHDPGIHTREPLSGLDVETISRVKDLMKRLTAEGKTIFYSSHLIDVVEKVCTRIAVLHRGRLIGTGSIDEVRMLSGAPTLEEALMKLWQEQV